jgi:hypothetical protein
LKNQINIIWYIDDIIERDEEICDEGEDRITDEQARSVLDLLESKYDAYQGINWGVIDYWIDQVKNAEYYADLIEDTNNQINPADSLGGIVEDYKDN